MTSIERLKRNNMITKYRVKKDFYYNPYGTALPYNSTHFKKGEIYEFEPYTGKCCKAGEMSCKSNLQPSYNNGFVWRPDFFNEHFEIVLE